MLRRLINTHEIIVFMLCKDNMPVRCVEKEGFVTLMKKVANKYKRPSRYKVRPILYVCQRAAMSVFKYDRITPSKNQINYTPSPETFCLQSSVEHDCIAYWS